MKKIIQGVCAAALLLSVAACASSQAQSDLNPPARKLDAKTQLECGNKRGCR